MGERANLCVCDGEDKQNFGVVVVGSLNPHSSGETLKRNFHPVAYIKKSVSQ